MRRGTQLLAALLGLSLLAALAGCDAGKPSAPTSRPPSPHAIYVVETVRDPSTLNGFHTDVLALAPSNGSVLWRRHVADSVSVHVVELEGVVYAASAYSPSPGTQPGFLDALDPATGVVLWHHNTSQSPIAPPVVASGVVYLTSGAVPLTATSPFYPSSFIEAISAHDGHTLWKTQVSGSSSAVAIGEGVLYVATFQPHSLSGLVAALDASTGGVRWTDPIAAPKSGQSDAETLAPFVANGLVYVESNAVNVFSAADGHLIWRYPLPVASSPLAVADGAVYLSWHAYPNAGPPADAAIALDAATGQVRWRYELPGNPSAPLVVDGTVYLSVNTPSAGTHGRVVALRASDGALLWQTPGVLPADDDLLGPPAGSAQGIAVMELNLTHGKALLSLLRTRDGSRVWSQDVDSTLGSLPVVSQDGVLYVYADITRAYTLLAYRASDGALLWQFRFTS